MADDFFSGVDQAETYAGEFKVKLPIFYRESRGFACVFPASLSKLRKSLPDRRFVPAQVVPGVGAVQIGVFEHMDTDVGPYNELFVAPVLNSPFLPVPGYNMLRQQLRMDYYTYLHHVPVSTEIALRKTEVFYGCETSLASIEFEDKDNKVTCEAKADGDLILRSSGRKIPALKAAVMKNFIHSYPQKQPQCAEVKVNLMQYTLSFDYRNAELTLGSSNQLASEISDLLLSAKPLMYLYAPSMQLILYGGENITLTSIRNFLRGKTGRTT